MRRGARRGRLAHLVARSRERRFERLDLAPTGGAQLRELVGRRVCCARVRFCRFDEITFAQLQRRDFLLERGLLAPARRLVFFTLQVGATELAEQRAEHWLEIVARHNLSRRRRCRRGTATAAVADRRTQQQLAEPLLAIDVQVHLILRFGHLRRDHNLLTLHALDLLLKHEDRRRDRIAPRF